jgi:hypothetical protein
MFALVPTLTEAVPRRTTPYAAVGITLPPRQSEPGVAALRANLAAAARRQSFGDLARYVAPQNFFWDRDINKRFDPKRTSAANLAVALNLESGTRAGWEILAGLAAAPTASESADRSGVLCAPGPPKFDQHDYDTLIDSTRTRQEDWVYPLARNVALRVSPRSSAAVVETLGTTFLRVLRYKTAAADAEPLHSGWTRIAAPSGNIGYVAPDSLSALSAPQLCYAKGFGGWVVAGFVGGN